MTGILILKFQHFLKVLKSWEIFWKVVERFVELEIFLQSKFRKISKKFNKRLRKFKIVSFKSSEKPQTVSNDFKSFE